jgi:predicted ATPase
MADAPPSIFISYAHADSSFVDRLEADLRQQGFDPWVDRQRLVGGQRWRRELQEAVKGAQVLLIVLSPNAIASPNVQIEYDYVLDRGKVVIPLYYRECDMPMELRAIQWIDFRHSYEQGVAALLQALRRQPELATPSSSSLQSTSNLQTGPASHNAPGAVAIRHPSNLPAQLTSLVGRQREIEAVSVLLRQDEVRLVTLTGMAGIGKTRLAVQVAAELAEQFVDGVFLVPLAPVNDAEQVSPAILQTLSISDISGQTPLQRIKAVLKEKQLLLLLDNFEQVVDAAVQVAELLSTCSRLKVLVTSRVVLHLQAEREFSVPPLSLPNLKRLPDLVTLSQYEAVVLFIQRSQAVKPDFAMTNANAPAVVAICVQLDGLPLAIELAAARSKYFAPQALLTRLEQGLAMLTGGARDLPARQQTLRGAIDWSYNLLTPEEQILFRRLAVFVDGCMLEAAEVVCQAAEELGGDILEGLLSLADKSLLRQQEAEGGEPRFWMLQTLREFGIEYLLSAGEADLTRQAHAEYYLALAEQAEPHLRGADQTHWFAQLQQEHENIRAGLGFLLERAYVQAGTPEGHAQAERALRLCVALNWFWFSRGFHREGLAFLEQALALRSNVTAPLRARVLFAASEQAWSVENDMKRGEMLCGESLTLYRELDDRTGIATCLNLLGSIARVRSQYALASSRLEEAAKLFNEIGDRWLRGQCHTELARIATEQGQYKQARELLEESLKLYQMLGDQERVSWIHYLLARLLFVSLQDFPSAQMLAEQALAEAMGPMYNAYPLGLLGELYLVRGDLVTARSLLEESLANHKETGLEGGDDIEPRVGLARLLTSQGNSRAARSLYQECLLLLSESDNYKEFMAASLEGLAALDVEQGESGKAARLWGMAEALREDMSAPIYPVYRADYEQAVAAARTELGEEAFAAAWAEGRMAPLEQVIDEILKTDG